MNINAFAITSLAGISTILGLFILNGNREEGIIPKALGFSAGVMIFVSLFDLLPSAIQYFQEEFIIGFHFLFCLLFILFGFLISILMNEAVHKRIENSNNLYQIGILSMLAIILHNIPEGIITYLTTTIEYKTGILLAVSIACHNIPEGICIAVPIYYSTKNKWKATKAVFLSAISEPVGALIAYLFLQENLSNLMIGIFLALVAGIMISLALMEILPEAKKYSLKDTLQYFLYGFGILLLSHLLF